MAEKKQAKEKEKKEEKTKGLVGAIATRGRAFQGYVTKKFEKRAVIEFERTVYVKKYERFAKKKTRLHARITNNLNINVGDYVEVKECRPLSKIIHFVVIKVLRMKDDKSKEERK